MTIHSFRRVLKVRRHMHTFREPGNGRVWTLPFPVPLLAFTYFVVLEVAFLILSRIPLLGVFAHLPAPWFWFWWLTPVWVAWWSVHTEFDGRTPHLWVRSALLFHLRPKRTRAGLALAEPEHRMRWRIRHWMDEHSPDLHRWRINGPARVHFNVPVRFQLGVLRRQSWVARPDEYAEDWQKHEVKDRLEVKP